MDHQKPLFTYRHLFTSHPFDNSNFTKDHFTRLHGICLGKQDYQHNADIMVQNFMREIMK